jgi:flagellar hook-basal body complex protein FliE
MSNFIIPLSSLPTITPLAQSGAVQNSQQLGAQNVPFMNYLQDAVTNLAETSAVSQAGLMSMATGGSDDLHTGAIDALKASTAVSYTASLASAAIRAYNELLRMQI